MSYASWRVPAVTAMHQAPTRDSDWLPLNHFHVELTPAYRGARATPRPTGSSELAAASCRASRLSRSGGNATPAGVAGWR
jgi:hypothetical protein